MSVCTFFGHRDCPDTVKPKLRQALVELIEERRVDSFYVATTAPSTAWSAPSSGS